MNIDNFNLGQLTPEQLEKSAKVQAKKFYTEAEEVLKKHLETPSEDLVKEIALLVSKPLNVISHLPKEALDSNPVFGQIAKFWDLVNVFLLSKSFD
jgi:hypothetical protein